MPAQRRAPPPTTNRARFARLHPRAVCLVAIALGAIVAACGGAATTPGPSATTPPASAIPVASVAPTTPAAPTASPAGERGGPHAEALVARLAEDPFIAHVEQLAEVTTTTGAGEIVVSAGMRADLSGDDMSFVLDLEAGGRESTQEVRVVGETAWLKDPDGSWSGAPRDALGDTLDGLLANIRIVSDPNDLQYVGLVSKNGRELHHLTAAGPIPYAPSTGGTGQYDTLDVWTEADGTPVRVEGTFTATDANGVRGTGSTELEFSMFGGPIDIQPPPTEPEAS